VRDLKYLNPGELTLPRGYTQVIKAGSIVWIAGQTAVDQNSDVVGKNDPEAQARQVYANLETAIRAAGGGLSNIVKITTYLTSRDYAPAMRRVRAEFFPKNPPTSTQVIVRGLARPEFLIEVEAMAVLGE